MDDGNIRIIENKLHQLECDRSQLIEENRRLRDDVDRLRLKSDDLDRSVTKKLQTIQQYKHTLLLKEDEITTLRQQNIDLSRKYDQQQALVQLFEEKSYKQMRELNNHVPIVKYNELLKDYETVSERCSSLEKRIAQLTHTALMAASTPLDNNSSTRSPQKAANTSCVHSPNRTQVHNSSVSGLVSDDDGDVSAIGRQHQSENLTQSHSPITPKQFLHLSYIDKYTAEKIEKEKVIGEVMKLQAEKEDLLKLLRDRERSIERSAAEIDALKQKLDDNEKRCVAMSIEDGTYRSKTAKYVEKYKRAKTEIAQKQTMIDLLNSQISELRLELHSSKEKLTESYTQLQRINDVTLSATSNASEIQRKCDDIGKDNAKLRELIDHLNCVIEEAEQKKTKLSEEIKLRDREIERRDKFINAFMEPSLRLLKLTTEQVPTSTKN